MVQLPMATETDKRRDLVVSREPVGPVRKSDQTKTEGEQAFNDALIMIVVAWIVLFLLTFSLRKHII